MNRWFSGNNTPDWGSASLSAVEARVVAQRVANVIKSLDPDVLCLQEDPSALAEMQLFLSNFLVSDTGTPLYNALIGSDGGAQKLHLLYKADGLVASADYATDALTTALHDTWDADVNGDLMLEPYDFTRQPLVVDVDPVGGQPVKIVILHTKSKYVHNGEALFSNEATRQIFIAQAMLARRRISAEAFRLRTYLDDMLQTEPEARIIVTGDFNDGPGRDFFERLYLTHNVTDILLGSTFYPSLIFDHPILRFTPVPAQFTARFDDYVDNVTDRPLLLDHFVVSPSLVDYISEAGIAHAEFEAELNGNGNGNRTSRPSDHRPIWATLSAALTS